MNRQDAEHLNLLSIFHYVLGGIVGLASFVPFIHVAIGIAMINQSPPSQGNEPNPALFGWFFVGIASAIILVGWVTAGCLIAAGYFLSQRRAHVFCLIVAGICCLNFPLGTVLGVFTFIVLMRPEVQQEFEAIRLGSSGRHDENE